MNQHIRQLLLVVALVGIVSLSFGTGSLSASSVERDFQGRIADDPDAYLGIEVVGFDRCEEQILLELENQYPGDIDLTLNVHVVDTEGVSVTSFDAPTTLASDGIAPVSGNLTAINGTTGPNSVTIRFVADGGGVHSELTRTYPVGCDA